jgi:hypothetical protein
LIGAIALAFGLAIAGASLPPLVTLGFLLAMLFGQVSFEILRTRGTAQVVEEAASYPSYPIDAQH